MPRSRMSLSTLLMALGLLSASAWAQEPPTDVEERLRKLEKKLEEQGSENTDLRREIEILQRQVFESGQVPVTEETVETRDGDRPRNLSERAAEQSERLAGNKGGVYAKPFLQRATSSTYVGGYIDLEYEDAQRSNRRFLQHRFVPYIFSQVTDRVSVAAEIEFEYGGSDAARSDGETKVEFATIDYSFSDAFGFRAGALLVPLGKFNLIHDSPVNDLTARPLVSTSVVPTTLTDAGLGFFGSTYPGEESKLDYEIYLVNGFQGLVETTDPTSLTGFQSNFSQSKGIRDGRPSLKTDNNNSVAGVGRVAFSPFLGLEVGASSHIGKYDDRADNWMWIYAFDMVWQPTGPFEVIAEFARAEISRDLRARLSGVPDDMWGVYGQANYHFMFDALQDALPSVFLPESTFTAVTRLEHVELGSARTERLTLGLNFRPTEETVFKLDYQFNWEDWSRTRVHNDAFVFSIATYF